MAENVVLWRDNQEVQAADLQNQQQWISDAIDHVVYDAVASEMYYTGFTISNTASRAD
jgi:hypothetical protein